jgi:hypothetical protein
LEFVQKLGDGRVFLNYGPIQMVLDISTSSGREPELGFAVAEYVVEQFQKLIEHMDVIKTGNCGRDIKSLPPVAYKMINAVEKTGDRSLTPLAAVAGSFSEIALEKALDMGGERVIINNGGDIALKDIKGRTVNVGVPLGGESVEPRLILPVKDGQNICGICTSGLGGRSFTKGIAEAAVVLAPSSSVADACATHIANETNVQAEGIIRCRAEEIDTNTDIPGHLITLRVGGLSRKDIYRALLNGYKAAERLYEQNIISGAVLCVKGEIIMLPEGIASLRK